MTINNPAIKPPIRPIVRVNAFQIKHRDKIHAAIASGELRREESVCFCGSKESFDLIEFDAWGLNNPTVICKRCFTLRSEYFFDAESMVKFYREEYYTAHMFTADTTSVHVGMDLRAYFEEEQDKGRKIRDYLSKTVPGSKFGTVLEIGCGAGGILEGFAEQGAKIFGCDYKEEYVEHGRRRQPSATLVVGGHDEFAGKQFDLIILSDVVEHLDQPREFFLSVQSLVHADSLIYINVPGFFGISSGRFGGTVRQYTKIEHTWCHTLESLTYLMALAGYERVAGTQYVRALFRKRATSPKPPGKLYFAKLLAFIGTLPVRRVLPLGKAAHGVKVNSRRLRRLIARR